MADAYLPLWPKKVGKSASELYNKAAVLHNIAAVLCDKDAVLYNAEILLCSMADPLHDKNSLSNDMVRVLFNMNEEMHIMNFKLHDTDAMLFNLPGKLNNSAADLFNKSVNPNHHLIVFSHAGLRFGNQRWYQVNARSLSRELRESGLV
jgi:hypothetical protein